MPWIASCPTSLISVIRSIPVDGEKKWNAIGEALNHINNLLKVIEESDMEICHLNFKLPLHEIDCILRCTTVPEKRIIYIMELATERKSYALWSW